MKHESKAYLPKVRRKNKYLLCINITHEIVVLLIENFKKIF